MPQYAGMPPDRGNYIDLDCGCKMVRVALPGNPWVYSYRCPEHSLEAS